MLDVHLARLRHARRHAQWLLEQRRLDLLRGEPPDAMAREDRFDLLEAERLGEPRLLSHVYTAAPQDAPLNGGALVTLAYPDSVQIAHPKQLGVYYRVGRSR